MPKWLVTVTATGCIVVDAADAETARRYVNENVTMQRMMAEGSFSDDSPVATDVDVDLDGLKVFYFETDDESGTGKLGTFPDEHPARPCSYIHAETEAAAREQLAAAGLNVTAIEEISE